MWLWLAICPVDIPNRNNIDGILHRINDHLSQSIGVQMNDPINVEIDALLQLPILRSAVIMWAVNIGKMVLNLIFELIHYPLAMTVAVINFQNQMRILASRLALFYPIQH